MIAATFVAARVPLPRQILVTAGFAVLADFLFHGHPVGLSLAIFVAVLGMAFVIMQELQLRHRAVIAAAVLWLGGCAALAEYVSVLSVVFALAGLVSLFVAPRYDWLFDTARWPRGALAFAVRAAPRLVHDLIAYRRLHRIARRRRPGIAWLRNWAVPLALSGVFLLLFARANPIIEDWLGWALGHDPSAVLDLRRILLWLATITGVWPFIRPRFDLPAASALLVPQPDRDTVAQLLDLLVGTPAILRALVAFNLIFAVQTGLDLAYLWGGRTLPDGLTYAQYAQRGAYPLVAAALLAGGFIIAALRTGADSARNPQVRGLILAWIAQTLMLLASSVWRTKLYVDAYSLTYMRAAALIWMLLVAAGIGWILVRILLDRPNGWLVRVNMLTAAAVLFASCFVDFGGAIAVHNVRYSRAVSGDGVPLDIGYLKEIGPAALPALMWYLDTAQPKGDDRWRVYEAITVLEDALAAMPQDWRGFSWRLHRLRDAVATPLDARPLDRADERRAASVP